MFRTRRTRYRAVLMSLAAALPLCPTPLLLAQGVLVGVTADVAVVHQSTSLPVFFNSSPACGVFESGLEVQPAFGGRITVASNPDSRLGLTGRVALSPSLGRLTASAPEPFTFTQGEIGDSAGIVEAHHEYRLRTQTVSLRLDLLLDYAVSERLRIHLGPSLGYNIGISVNTTDYITDGTYRFSGGAREQDVPGQELAATQKLIIGGRAGISYEMPLGSSVLFVPEFVLRTEFTPLFQQAGRFAFGPGIGFSILSRLSGGATVPESVAEDVPPPDTPSAAPLRASIALRGTDDLGRTHPWALVRVFETFRRSGPGEEWHVERRTESPMLLVEPEYVSTNGIGEWSVRFLYRGTVIGSSSSRDTAMPASIDWKIVDEPASDSAHPLSVELTVVDSSGATVTTADRIPLRIERLSRIVDDRGDSVIYTLYAEPDNPGAPMKENLGVLREIASHADEGGRMEIIGLTERTESGPPAGSPEREKVGTDVAEISDELVRLLMERGASTPRITTQMRMVDSFTCSACSELPAERIKRSRIAVIVHRARR